MIKIAIFSDIHGNSTALEYVLADARKQNINHFICLGDIVLKGPAPQKTLKMIKNLNLIALIKGNTENWLTNKPEKQENRKNKYTQYGKKYLTKANLKFLASLPAQKRKTWVNHKLLLTHGSPRSNTERMDYKSPWAKLKKILTEVEADVILVGHSHRICSLQVENKQIINVGSVGAPYDGDKRASYVILKLNKERIQLKQRRVAYPVDKTITLAVRRSLPFLTSYKYMLKEADKPKHN